MGDFIGDFISNIIAFFLGAALFNNIMFLIFVGGICLVVGLFWGLKVKAKRREQLLALQETLEDTVAEPAKNAVISIGKATKSVSKDIGKAVEDITKKAS
ncbi:MAG: hypothetical protein OYH77_07800 [Pseudomonadota bacterium]|nr:hypothetical protein [Pseudomonadota bacterium]